MSDKACSSKKIKLSEDNNLEESEVDSTIVQLERIHLELDNITERENEEIIAVEQKYVMMKQKLYNDRSEIIENLPDFWSNVFTSHPEVCNLLYEEEEDCLHYLHKFEVETPENVRGGYNLKFYFRENPYFKNDLLVKEIKYKDGSLSSSVTTIDWKKPMASKEMPMKGRKRSGQFGHTFFSWLTNSDPANDGIAEIIKDDVWPNALQFYLVPDSDVEGNGKDDDSTDSSDNEVNKGESNECSK